MRRRRYSLTPLVFDQSQVVRHVERKYYRRRRAAWPCAAVNLPFRLARTAARRLAANWSTEIQIPGDPKQAGSASLSRLKILSFWKRPG
jgi:hypothetical protein